eukprot:IDg10561t1
MDTMNAHTAWSHAQSPLSGAALEPVVQKHLRRVYSALLTACVSAAAGCAVQLSLRWDSHLLSIAALFASMFYFSSLAQHSPRRYPAFLACAFAQGWSLGPLLRIAGAFAPAAPMLALLGAAAVFAALSMSAIYA